MQAPDSKPLMGTGTGATADFASLLGTSDRAVRKASPPVKTRARASAVRNRDDDPCRRRRRAATCGGLEIGRVILTVALGNRRSRPRYLIRPFSRVETFLLASGSMLRTARMTMNAL